MPRLGLFAQKIEVNPVFRVQVPSKGDISGMRQMSSGHNEDQRVRLDQMVQAVNRHLPPQYKCVKTETTDLLKNWTPIFSAIIDGDAEKAITIFNALAEKNDLIYQTLVAVHEKTYLTEFIRTCASKSASKPKRPRQEENSDLVINNDTFEILLKDLATTLSNKSKLYFSFGLPTHHAFSDKGSGFCLLNKTAALIAATESQHDPEDKPLNHLVIGIDVNRDDGLNAILKSKFSRNNILHIDVYDSQVYPYQNFAEIKDEFETTGVEEDVDCGLQDNYMYVSIDLLKNQRQSTDDIHPAIKKTVEQIHSYLKDTYEPGEKIAIYVPIGWDSHQGELANCGKMLDEDKGEKRRMKSDEVKLRRFNDADFVYFNKALLDLYNKDPHNVVIYWGLEGGYTSDLFEKLIHSTITTIDEGIAEGVQSKPKPTCHIF